MASWRDDPVVGGSAPAAAAPAPATDAPAWQRDAEVPVTQAAAETQQPETWPEYLKGVAGSATRGATFGFSDELTGAVQGGIAKLKGEDYGPAYEKARDRARAEDKKFAERHPVQDVAAQIGGGGASMLLGGEIPAVARGLQMAGRLVPAAADILPARVLAATPDWLSGALGWGARNAAPAAAGGAVQGFGEGEGGFGNRAVNAAEGAGIGAVAGPLVAGAVQGGSALARGAARNLGFGDPEKLADNLILRNLERDNVSLADLRTRAGAAPEPAILPDMGGRNVQQLAGSAANLPGRGMEAADQVVQLRRGGAPERLQGASDTAFGGGSGGDVAAERADLIANRRAAAAPLYDTAFQATVADNPDLRRMLAMPEIQQGIQRGLDIQRIEAGATGQPSARSGPELLDAAKRGLDDMLERYRNPNTGRLELDQQGRAIEQLRQSFVSATDAAVPELAAARQAWAGPSQALDAIDRGRRGLTQDRDIVAATTGRLSPADQPFYQLGMGRAVSDQFADPARAAGNARRLLEDRNMQARIEAALPDPAARDPLNRALQREVDMAAVNRTISPRAGSPTARNAAGMEDIGAGGQLAAEVLQGAERGGVTGAVARGYNAIMQRGRGLRPDVGEALADRLFTSDPAQIQTAIDSLSRRAQARALTPQMQQALANRLLLTTGAQTGPRLTRN